MRGGGPAISKSSNPLLQDKGQVRQSCINDGESLQLIRSSLVNFEPDIVRMETPRNVLNASEDIERLSSIQIFNHVARQIALKNKLNQTNTLLMLSDGPDLVIKSAGDCFAMKPVFDKQVYDRPRTNYNPANLNQHQVLQRNNLSPAPHSVMLNFNSPQNEIEITNNNRLQDIHAQKQLGSLRQQSDSIHQQEIEVQDMPLRIQNEQVNCEINVAIEDVDSFVEIVLNDSFETENKDYNNQSQMKNITATYEAPNKNINEQVSSNLNYSINVQISDRCKPPPKEDEKKVKKLKEVEFKYDKRSLYMFKSEWRVRKIIIQTVDSKYFENLMILVIILNCISLGLFDYTDRNSMTLQNQMIDKSNMFFTCIFIIEAILKIVAYGLCIHQNAYLRSGWNIIDAVVVLSAILELSIESVKLKSLRILRIFRPLKTINAFPGMKKLISALIASIPDFANVILFLVFIFMLFATLGLHQYNGAFYNACRVNNVPESSESWEADVSSGRLCSTSGLGNYQCDNNLHCGNPSEYTYLDYSKSEDMNQRDYLNFGITNFDNIGTSLLSVFQIITSDTWYQQICNFMDVDMPAFGGLYCMLMIIIGQFFLLNLFLAVIVFAFIKSQKPDVQNEIMMLKAEQDKDEQKNEGTIPKKQPTRREILEEYTQTGAHGPKNHNSPKSKQLKRSITQRQQQRLSSFDIAAGNQVGLTTVNKQQEQAKIDAIDFTTFLKSQVKKRNIANMFLSSMTAGKDKKQKALRDKSPGRITPKKLQKSSLGGIFSEALKQTQQEDTPSQLFKLTLKDEEDDKVVASTSTMKLVTEQKKEEILQEEEVKVDVPNDNDKSQPPPLFNRITQLVGLFMKHKVQNEYETYFKGVLNDAQNQSKTQQTSLRHLVSIKVGLQYMKNRQEKQDRHNEQRKNKRDRKKESKIFKVALNISESPYFQWFVAVIIMCNTAILSLDKYPVNLPQAYVLEKVNIAFTLIFTLEMIIKLVALGLKGYFRGTWFNSFDCLIVIASLIDLIVSNTILTSGKQGKMNLVTALRALRLLRVFKLAKQWKRFELLLETMGKSFKEIANFAVFMFLFIFIFTLLGLELFAYKAKFKPDTSEIDLIDGVSPTFNFDTFLNSFSLVFIILTNDGQAAVYYNYYRTVGPAPATIFFVLLVVIGQKVIINLFVAILLENFDEGSLKQKLYEIEQAQVNSRMQMLKTKINSLKETINNKFMWILNACPRGVTKTESINDKAAKLKKPIDYTEEENIGNSLFIFPKDGFVRNYTTKLVKNIIFEYVIIVVIFLSAITLALQGPLVDPNSLFKMRLYWVDTAMTAIFILEALLKIISFGFLFNGRNSYLRQSWNQLDLLIIMFSLLSLTPLSDNYKAFKVLRVLRIISRNEGLKVAVRALIRALPNVVNVTSIMILFLLIFGVIAVSEFKGKFYFCDNEGVVEAGPVLQKWDCLNTGGVWQNFVYNFDNIPNALVTLFVMTTTAGWQDVLMNSITSTEIDYVSSEERSTIWSLFFVLFMIIGYFFFINLFIGVVVSTFNSENDKIGGNDLLTEKQREWIDLKLMVLRSAPIKKIRPPPQGSFRMVFYKIQNLNAFNNFIFVCIALNTIILSLKWYQQPEIMTNFLEISNYIFTGVFLIEAIIKMLGQGFLPYFNDSWNKFDFFIVVTSLVSIGISANSQLNINGVTTLLRSFRVLRILRLLKRGARSMHMIFNTFVITLQSLSNIGCLLLLVIYIYSILGMIIFGQVKRNGLMNNYMNFENFINAFITLFTVVTGDSWNATQTSFVVINDSNNQCIENPTYADYLLQGVTVGCGGRAYAYLFFTSFVFIVTLIFLQLFIAIILQGYDHTQIQEARLFNDQMTGQFRELWADYDPDATTFITLYQLRDFLFAIAAPVGFDKSFEGQRFMQDKFIASLDLPTYQNFSKYQFLDVLDALSFRLMVIDHLKQKRRRVKSNRLGEIFDQSSVNVDSSINEDVMSRQNTDLELEVKDQLSKEINLLLYQEKSENITVVQSIMLKEMNKLKQKDQNKDAHGLTSSHHMAAEASVRRMKEFIKLCRMQKYQMADQTNMRQGSKTTRIPRQSSHGSFTAEAKKTSLIDRYHLYQIDEESKQQEECDQTERFFLGRSL